MFIELYLHITRIHTPFGFPMIEEGACAVVILSVRVVDEITGLVVVE